MLNSRLVGAIAALYVFCAAASAQSVTSHTGPMVFPLMKSSVDRYAAMLGADPEQRSSINTLYRGYRTALAQARSQADKTLEKLPKDPEKGAGAPALEATNQFIQTARALEASFFADMKATLSPDQAQRFDAVERARRREIGSRFSLAAGEGVDLVVIARTVNVPADGPAAAALAEYESATDLLMKSKSQMFDDIFKRVGQSEFEGHDADPQTISEVMKELVNHSLRVRDSNRRYARIIRDQLPEDIRAAWDQAIRSACYPRIYARGRFQGALNAADKLPDLSPQQRTDLTDLRTVYTQGAEPINARWAAAIDEKQSTLADAGVNAYLEMANLPADDPLRTARRARTELDTAMLDRLKSILTPAQNAIVADKQPAKTDDAQTNIQDILPEGVQNDPFEDFDKDADAD